MSPQAAQLALDLDATPAHGRRDLDMVHATIALARDRAEEERWRSERAPAPCACDRALIDGDRCAKCGREVP
jgi:hypothetical protein